MDSTVVIIRTRLAVPTAVGFTAFAPFVQPAFSVAPYTMRFGGVLLSACVWLWAWALNPAAFRTPRRLTMAAVALAAATVVAAIASPSRTMLLTWGAEDSLMGAASWLALLAVFVLAASSRPSIRVVGALRLIFAWGAVSAAIVLWERASGAPQVTGGFGNANYAGAALATLVPLALFYASAEHEARLRPWWRYLVLTLVAGCLATGSVSAIVALAVAVTGVSLLAPGPLLGIARTTGRRVAGGVIVAVVVLALLASASLAGDVLPEPVDSFMTQRVAGDTVLTRIEMWKMAVAIFADHPLLGVGPDGMQLASQGYLSERLLTLESGGYSDYRVLMKDPHSLPLLALGSLGLVGIAVLAWLVSEWARLARSLVSRGTSESPSWALRCALVVSVATCVAALLFMPWAVSFGPLVPLIAGLATAGGANQHHGAPADAEVTRAKSSGASLPVVRPAVAALATVVALWLAGTAAYSDTQVSSAYGQSAPELARAAYLRAQRAQPWRPYLAYEALYATGFLASEGLSDLESYRKQVDTAPDGVLRNAGFVANLVQLSLDEAYLGGRTDLSWETERIQRASRLAPSHPDVILEQAHLALLSGEVAQARGLLERTAALVPRAPRYLLYSYYLALASGDVTKARELEPQIEATGPGHSRLMRGWNRPPPNPR